jgi:hypothetical protein
MIAGVIPVTEMFFKCENLTWARILPWTPWVLVFVLANASGEELILRGLLIGKMEPFLGKFATNIVTTIPFVMLHAYTILSGHNHLPRSISPAAFSGVVLAYAKNEQYLGLHPVPCRAGYSCLCRDSLKATISQESFHPLVHPAGGHAGVFADHAAPAVLH